MAMDGIGKSSNGSHDFVSKFNKGVVILFISASALFGLYAMIRPPITCENFTQQNFRLSDQFINQQCYTDPGLQTYATSVMDESRPQDANKRGRLAQGASAHFYYWTPSILLCCGALVTVVLVVQSKILTCFCSNSFHLHQLLSKPTMDSDSSKTAIELMKKIKLKAYSPLFSIIFTIGPLFPTLMFIFILNGLTGAIFESEQRNWTWGYAILQSIVSNQPLRPFYTDSFCVFKFTQSYDSLTYEACHCELDMIRAYMMTFFVAYFALVFGMLFNMISLISRALNCFIPLKLHRELNSYHSHQLEKHYMNMDIAFILKRMKSHDELAFDHLMNTIVDHIGDENTENDSLATKSSAVSMDQLAISFANVNHTESNLA